MKDLLALIDWNSKATVVSLGCGAGWWEVQLMHQKPPKKLILIDSNPVVLNENDLRDTFAYFEKVYQKPLATNVEFHLESAEKTSLPDREADVIFLFNSFHEFEHKENTVQEMYRICKSGGQIFIEEELASPTKQVHADCGKALFFEQELIELMEKFGFQFLAKTKKDEKASYLTFEK
jgi:ubiquinone/menaquinone biosynthesis C-methylase UbiE